MADNEIQEYLTPDGDSPFGDRLQGLRDARAAVRISAAIDKMRHGLFGDWKKAGDGGAKETRIDYGPGYRIYYGMDGNKLVILLLCGDKRTQSNDIEVAHDYWQDYKSRK